MDADGRGPIGDGYLLACRAFEAARTGRAPVVSRHVLLADRQVRVRIAGEQLANAFLSPWSHLAAEPAAGEDDALCIDVWHERETGIPAPDLHDAIDPCSRFPFRASADNRVLACRQPETSVWLDRAAGHIVAVVRDVDRRALYEAGRPIELPILIWLRDAGIPLAHASFVASDGRGALILGRSGSGKSTLAARCVAEGFSFLSDDKIAVTRSGGLFVGHSLTSSLHVDRETLRRVPALVPHATPPTLPVDDKLRVAVERWAPDRLVRSADISALIIPSLAAGAGIRPASRRESFLALSLSTLLSLPIAADRSLDPLADLVERVPAFVVDLNPEAGAAARVASILARR